MPPNEVGPRDTTPEGPDTSNTSADQSTDTAKPNGYRRQDGYAAPTAEDRREAAMLAEAAEMARLAIQCPGCVQVSKVHGCFPNCGAR
jgi:hypothetical protein